MVKDRREAFLERSTRQLRKLCLAPLRVRSATLSSRETRKEHWHCHLHEAQPDVPPTECGRNVAYSLLDHFSCSEPLLDTALRALRATGHESLPHREQLGDQPCRAPTTSPSSS